mmetsp:Transcript_15685/g.59658  ORF Transcript_15685/g.59658 Transcript_15685/m.59658 type:complete len:252 (-) Transcript_15685:102-857(-)
MKGFGGARARVVLVRSVDVQPESVSPDPLASTEIRVQVAVERPDLHALPKLLRQELHLLRKLSSRLCCVKVHEPDMLAGRIREASLRELAHRPVHAVEVVHLPRPLVPTPGEAPAAPRTKASASSREGEARAATEAASRAENVLEHLEGVLSAVELEASAATAASATCLLVLQAFLSDLVVNPALLGVTKHLIGLGNLGKLLLSPLLVVRILVRVVLERQFPVRLLQGRLVSIALDAQELVVVFAGQRRSD